MASADLYAPSLAHLPFLFATTAEKVKLTMSLNVLAYALATLIHGPLSERFGRRPVLLWGLVGFTFFSLMCAIAQDINQLIIARVFQGICAAVEGVLVLAIIRDIFEETEQIRVIALYGMASALTPAIAPVIGGYVHVLFGWRMNFYLLFFLGLIVATASWYFLQESSQKKTATLNIHSILREYASLLQNRSYLCYCIMLGSGLGIFFAFITAGPFILINNHGLATQHFGYFQCILVAGFILGSLAASRLAGKLATATLLKLGLGITLCSAGLTLGITYHSTETITTLGLAMFLITLGAGPVFATTPALAMEASKSSTGTAAALLVTFEMGFCALAAFAVGVLHDGSSRPFGLSVAGLALCAALAHFLLTDTNHKGQEKSVN